MKFTHKVTARNIIRQKRHFYMAVTGIAGCTALMVAGFGLHNSMTDIAKTQFTKILKYDVQIDLTENIFYDLSHPEITDKIYVHIESGYIIKGNERYSIRIIVPKDTHALNKFINFVNRRSGVPILFSGTQVILTEKIAEELNIKIGDNFILENSGGFRGSFILTDITENYVGIKTYISPENYQQEFGGDLSFLSILAHTGINDEEKKDLFVYEMLKNESIRSVEFTSQIQKSYANLLHSISFVVLVIIFASGALAMIVLYNLTNINISERTREIATLRVLGFRKNEAAAYIFREITILGIIGALAGLFLGIPFHHFVISVAENPDLMFGRRIAPLSYIFSLLFTLVFSIGVCLLMIKKLDNIKIADSLKAAD